MDKPIYTAKRLPVAILDRIGRNSSHVESVNNTSCLDIGCGTGGLARDLYHKGYRCIGIDVSREVIRIAREATIFEDGLKYIHGNFETDDLTAIAVTQPPLAMRKLVYAFIRDKSKFHEKVYDMMTDEGAFVIITPLHTEQIDATPISADEQEASHELSNRSKITSRLEFGWATCFICTK